jgi:hypothetical protein
VRAHFEGSVFGAFYFFRYIKVDHYNPREIFRNKDIAWLDITVADPVLMQECNPAHDLLEEVLGNLLSVTLLLSRDLLENLGAFDVLHHEVHIILERVIEDLQHLHYIWVVQALDNLKFGLVRCDFLWVVVTDNLNGELLVTVVVFFA